MLKTVFRFGLIVIALLILFQLSNASLFIPAIPADTIIGITAIILVGLGIYLGGNLGKQKIVEVEVEVEPTVEVDEQRITELGIS